MVKFKDPHIGSIKALDARWKDAIGRHPIHSVVGVMMLFVEDTTPRRKLLTRLPIVGTELKDETLCRISHCYVFSKCLKTGPWQLTIDYQANVPLYTETFSR